MRSRHLRRDFYRRKQITSARIAGSSDVNMRKIVHTLLSAALAALIIVSLTACNRSAEQYFVFGTFLEISADSGEAELAQAAAEYMEELERTVSASVEGSDIWNINHAAAGESVECSAVTVELLLKAREIYRLTEGAYDPSVYPLVKLWGFAPGDFVAGAPMSPPSDEEIAAELAKVGFGEDDFVIDADNLTVTKHKEGAMLDLGGITKGYAVEKALGFADGGNALINLGGNIGVSGRTYTIGVGSPRESEKGYLGTLSLYAGECITTSGDYERYFEYGGERYHHIINPFTGRPAKSGLISVTVIASDGGFGDAFATALIVAGAEKGGEWLENLSEKGVCAVLVYDDMSLEAIGREFTKA